MATKTISTRIKNRYDSLTNWEKAGVTLLPGEIALVSVTTQEKQTVVNENGDTTVKVVEVPAVLMKVGEVTSATDSTPKAFKDLPWLSAKAADVYAWAKQDTIEGVQVTVEGGKLSTLGAYLKQININTSDIADNAKAIATLTGGDNKDGSVSSMIRAAIEALDYKESESIPETSENKIAFVTAVTQTDGIIEVKKREIIEADLPSISSDKITIGTSTATGTLTAKLKVIEAAIAEKSDDGHTHNYAGSDTEGGPANSVKAALTFSTSGNGAVNGTTYNGSAAKTISYNSVGAAPASHTHTKSEITDFAHNHNDLYYTESEVDSKIAEHNHDDRYYTESEVDSKIASAVSSVLSYKGTKTTTAELPTSGNATGDVWNITNACAAGTSADGKVSLPKVNAGDNVAWNGTTWDVLAGTVDLSNYYNKSAVDASLATKAEKDHKHPDDYAPISHGHGNINSNGTITSNTVSAADGILVYDSSKMIQRATTADTWAILRSSALGDTATTAAKGDHKHGGYESQLLNIETNYVRYNSTDKKLYVGENTTDTIIFDCGGAE
jgi:hypothetical protein